MAEISLRKPRRVYFLKKQSIDEAPLIKNTSIFQSIPHEEVSCRKQMQFKSISTEMEQVNRLKTIDSDASYHWGESLPKIEMASKFTFLNKLSLHNESTIHTDHPQALVLSDRMQFMDLPNQMKIKPLERGKSHLSDPIYLRNKLSNQQRIKQKYTKYRTDWLMQISSRQKGKSLVERSLEKAQVYIAKQGEDVAYRKYACNFADKLRNNISEQTFIEHAQFNKNIPGLKGRGGPTVPLFDQVYIVEEVFKADRRK